MKDSANSESLSESVRALGTLFDQGTRLALSLLGSLGTNSAQVFSAVLDSSSGRRRRGRSCDIPPPCWMPQPAGEVHSQACPGAAATIRLGITNDSMNTRKVSIFTTRAVPGLSISAASLTLDPMERGIAVVSFEVPAAAKECDETEILLWIKGCRIHYLRWRISAESSCAGACTTVEICDGPDLVHHWYDHFYCPRGCGERTPGNG